MKPRKKQLIIAAAAAVLLAVVLFLSWPRIYFMLYPRRNFHARQLTTSATEPAFQTLAEAHPEIQAIRCYDFHGRMFVGISINTGAKDAVARIAAAAEAALGSEEFVSALVVEPDGSLDHFRIQCPLILTIYQDYQERLYRSWAEYFEEGTAPDDPYILDHVDGFQTWTGYYADDPSGTFYEPWYE